MSGAKALHTVFFRIFFKFQFSPCKYICRNTTRLDMKNIVIRIPIKTSVEKQINLTLLKIFHSEFLFPEISFSKLKSSFRRPKNKGKKEGLFLIDAFLCTFSKVPLEFFAFFKDKMTAFHAPRLRFKCLSFCLSFFE